MRMTQTIKAEYIRYTKKIIKKTCIKNVERRGFKYIFNFWIDVNLKKTI